MAQVQRIDLLQNNFACATAKFPATYPVFLSGKVTRDVFFADVEELNKIISTATAIMYAVRRADGVGRALLRKLWGGQVGDN